ncbi:S41 family peptidase [Bacillus sp. S/N-304-OC-R1]|uniref:S41 family peptidase n=1 Tax=Bacillus sp. S/N-304-OC-R1 TaxID=2758034 RepID=UPI001C8CF6D4|nr:S41 family peptidase [Bacillus sp. S/N-304-OC-R1]MBY0121568.1 hypothetical protein [Bacillus sp. S/N-304-OC-R1]
MKANFIVLFFCLLVFFLTSCVKNDDILSSDEILKLEVLNYDDYLSPEVMKADFKFLVKKILEVHPDPKRNIGDNWDRLVQQTESQFNKPMSAREYAISLMSFTSQLKDAHTGVYPMNMKDKFLPVKFEWVKEGLLIVESNNELLQVGDLVIKVGNYSIEEVINFMSRIISAENEYWIKEKGKDFLTREIFLRSLSVWKDHSVSLTIERNNKLLTFDVDLVDRNELQIKNKEASPWFSWEILEDKGIGYFNISESMMTIYYDKKVLMFFEEMERKNIGKLVIDLRKNSGGTSEVMTPFLKHIQIEPIYSMTSKVKYSEEAMKQIGYQETFGLKEYHSQVGESTLREPQFNGEIFILTSYATFSSGNMFAVHFHDTKKATIIGEPTGNKPTQFGDPLPVELPFTKYTLVISHKEFMRPDQSLNSEPTLLPDILIEKEKEDFLYGKDGQLERILSLISNE